MTRLDAAKKIAAAVTEDKYSARVWTGGDKVRVYFRHSRKGDLGHVDLGLDGSIHWSVTGNVVRPAGERALVGLTIDVEAPIAAPPALSADESEAEAAAREIAESEERGEVG